MKVILIIMLYVVIGIICKYVYSRYALNYLLKMAFKYQDRDMMEMTVKALSAMRQTYVMWVLIFIWPILAITTILGLLALKVIDIICK